MWIVSWMLNGKSYTASFEFQTTALMKMIQLESYGLQPTLHQK